jgi:hypothetical protein
LPCADEHAPITQAKIITALMSTKNRNGPPSDFRFGAGKCPIGDCEHDGCCMVVLPAI